MLVPVALLVIDIEGVAAVAAIATIAGAAAAAQVVVALLRLHDRYGGAEAKQARRLLSAVGRHAPPRHGGLQCVAASHGLSRTVWRDDATHPPGRIEDGGKAGGVEDIARSPPD